MRTTAIVPEPADGSFDPIRMLRTVIVHLVSRTDWLSADPSSAYRPESLDVEGFIHCCDPDQVARVVASWYPARSDLLALEIDPDRLDSPVIREDFYGHGDFPHIYGGIDKEAIVSIRPVRLDAHGDATLGEREPSTRVSRPEGTARTP